MAFQFLRCFCGMRAPLPALVFSRGLCTLPYLPARDGPPLPPQTLGSWKCTSVFLFCRSQAFCYLPQSACPCTEAMLRHSTGSSVLRHRKYHRHGAIFVSIPPATEQRRQGIGPAAAHASPEERQSRKFRWRHRPVVSTMLQCASPLAATWV